MAPRTGARRNQSQSEEIYELGKQGRKTGITIRDTGARDEHGMQPLEDIFSSPEKTATVNMNAARTPSVSGAQYSENEDDDSDDFPMDIENTTAPDPARLMNGVKMPLPRARSPAKTFLQSPARKNQHLGPSSSPVRGSIVEQRAREEAERGQSPKRRLDFGLNGASSRPVLKPTRSSPRTTRKGRETSRDEEDDDEEAILQGQDDTDGHEESMALVDVGGGDDMPINGDGDDVELGEESRNEDVHEPNGHAPRRATRRSGRLSESLLADDTGDLPEAEEEEEEEEEAENEEEPEAEPSPVQSKKRGRPAGKAAAVQQHEEEEEEVSQRATKRRRSNNPVEPEPEPKKSAGRPRGRPAAVAKATTGTTSELKEASASTAQKPKGKRGRPAKAAARRSESPGAAAADTSLAVVPRGPPLPKSRGLLINRRVEVPGSNDGILRTRSGRNSFKPLAFWRNEHVDYDQDAATEDVFTRGGGKVGKVLLPTVKEIVRVEQEEAPTKKKPGYKSKSSTATSKSKRATSGSNPFFDPDPADPWEEEPGSVTGDAVVWRTEYDWFPPALEDEVEVEPEQLAVSGQAIQTREIRNATFKFAKTLSMPFYGAGVVDLPPGAEKRPKNSRKMYMTFFVHSGRVLVTVNETSFRISRGGMWFVPRGNTYSIENDYDEPARVFFSQGCEPLQRPPDAGDDSALAEGA
ncbi:hypothetical protein CONLIGDRAFT_445711 [Coniochaeta ligniaria NRRL 30616]|uniref:CENP-C homolog n=1 Tax=Coniochaeta ligniaria NRRL 30616 TaxID=1408157 RepID=A0A1J7IJY5_9PEZI|nr:hypothetical protein CONLIGDRAFT_445711 [Coniochaeta ligniaria NRRL 30616]